MRRTYRSKKDTGGILDHRDMALSVDSKSSVFDAYYIKNIKQVKREMSCIASSNICTAPSYKVRKRKYVKRLKEPDTVQESVSESAYLTPDKSIHVNRVPDLFDQLLNTSTHVSPKSITKSTINDNKLLQHRMPKRTYCRKKRSTVKKPNHCSSESTDSDKENSLSDESNFNTSNIKTHKLIIEKERLSSPLHHNDSIHNITKKLTVLNKLSRENRKESKSGEFDNINTNITHTPLSHTSPQCSTPFHEKYRGKSIYNFSPIKTHFLEESVKHEDETGNTSTAISKNDQVDHYRTENGSIENITDIESIVGIIDINRTRKTKDTPYGNETMDNYPIISHSFSNNQSLYTTELEPFLGFAVNSPVHKLQGKFNDLENVGDDLVGKVAGDETQLQSNLKMCKSLESLSYSLESNIKCYSKTNRNNEDFKNNTPSSVSEFSENESLYDTCDNEDISDFTTEEEKPKELIVAVQRMNDSVFQKYYKRMIDSSLNNGNSDGFNMSVSDNDTSNYIKSDGKCFKQLEAQDDMLNNSESNSVHSDKQRFDSTNLEVSDIQIISSSENENSDTNDIEEEDKCFSFVTTRKRNDVTNDSFLLNLDNSYNSVSSASLDKTVLSYYKEKLKETDLIDNTLVNYSNEGNDCDNHIEIEEQIKSDMSLKPKENEYTELPVKIVTDEEVNNINTRKSSKLFRESTYRTSQTHFDETSSSLIQGIVLKPGKQWERSLSIYKRMTIMGDTFDYTTLNDESMKSKGRKYRQSVISTMEMQEYKGSLHNESVFSRRSTFVSKPRRSTIKIVKDPNASSISLSSSILYEDLEGFLNGDCDDTIIELSKLSIGDCGHEVTVLDKFHDTSNRIVTARDYVLRRCNQTEPVLFDECYPDTVLKNCRKIGEGVYGEVFLWRAGDGRARVMKIVPIAGATRVNGEEQKDYHEIISEIVIAMELSALRAPIPEIERQLDDGKEIDALDLHSVQNATDVFNEVLAIRCVYGAYPLRLLDLWELYDECKGSENDNPAALPADQQYIVLELANAGQDLESYQFMNAEQACALFKQIALGLAVAEEACQFEHRDLHWGNVLIAPTDQKCATFVVRGRLYRTARCGVAATLIDYSLSRAARDGRALYNDLADDDALFDAVGDYQFEVYRLMRDKLGNDWKNFEPYTNILWLHYTVDKMITALRYTRTNTKIHKHYIAKLKEIKNRVLNYGSATQFILTDNEF